MWTSMQKTLKAQKFIDHPNTENSLTNQQHLDIFKEGHFSTSITSHCNSKTHNIKQSVTCKPNNVCHLIDCSKCKQQYVGETELEFHCRMKNHKSDIRLENKSNGIVRHFSKCGMDNVTPNISGKVRSRDHYIRKAREQYYIEFLEPLINAQ